MVRNFSLRTIVIEIFIISRSENTSFPHNLATIEVSQYFCNYFVNEARKNGHVFIDKQELFDQLIENYPPQFTAKDGSNYFQAYLFDNQK